jgi:hypothetical protein
MAPPQLKPYSRADLRVIPVELLLLTFVWIDYLLMRSELIRDLHGDRFMEILTRYLHRLKGVLEPTGRSEEFLPQLERELRVYNADLDHIFREGEKRNRYKLE